MAEGLSPDRVPQDDSEDKFDALLSALNHDLENLVKKIEGANAIARGKIVEKLGRKVDELTAAVHVKKDSLQTMRDHLDNLSREWESISKIFKSDDKLCPV